MNILLGRSELKSGEQGEGLLIMTSGRLRGYVDSCRFLHPLHNTHACSKGLIGSTGERGTFLLGIAS